MRTRNSYGKPRRPGVSAAGPGAISPPKMTPATASGERSKLPPGFGTAANVPIPRPIDPQEMATRNVAQRDYATNEAGFANEEGRVKAEYGLDDPSNPFSKAQLLKENFERAKAASVNSYASRGQLYSGALQASQGRAQRLYDQDYAGLRSSQTGLLDDIIQRRRRNGDQLADTTDTAEGDAVARAVATPVDPTTVPKKKRSGPKHPKRSHYLL